MWKLKKIKVTEYNLNFDLPLVFKFVFVSDLHGCNNEPILNIIEETNADALLVGGDFIHDKDNYKRGLDFLKKASKIIPTFCSLGNHEFRFDEDMCPAIIDTGAKVLDNSYIDFNGIKIGGFTSGVGLGAKKDRSAAKRKPDIKWLGEFAKLEGFKLLLCHHPEYFSKYIEETSIDLTLSGHAHGGQWRIFNRGVYAPGQGVFPEFTSGIHKNRLIVSRGLGNPHLIPRINNKPEIIIVNLNKKP